MPMSVLASWSAKFLSRAMTSEGLFGLTGCAMAVASGSFALYMTMHGPAGRPAGASHDFTVFAQMTSRGRATTHGKAQPPVETADEIDPVVTGSIPSHADRAAPATITREVAVADDRPILTNVLLRQIDGDNALVEMNDSLVVFKLGDIIPGAGRLVAMTHQGGRPALETSKGLIVESR